MPYHAPLDICTMKELTCTLSYLADPRLHSLLSYSKALPNCTNVNRTDGNTIDLHKRDTAKTHMVSDWHTG